MAIYPAITSITPGGCFKKINEISRLKLKTVCLFPTTLKQPERWQVYRKLKRAGIRKIPLVHLRNEDMDNEEIYYLQQQFKVEAFNLHATGCYAVSRDYQDLNQKIYLENTAEKIFEKQIKKFAGLCLDTTHLEDVRRSDKKLYQHFIGLLKKYPLGCVHIGAISETRHPDPGGCKLMIYESHLFEKLSDFDYLINYRKFLKNIVALELENSLSEQLRAKKYIEQKLKL